MSKKHRALLVGCLIGAMAAVAWGQSTPFPRWRLISPTGQQVQVDSSGALLVTTATPTTYAQATITPSTFPRVMLVDADSTTGAKINDSGQLHVTLSGGGSADLGATTITSTSANALAVGPSGTTNPTLQIDASTASAVGGLKVTGNTTTNGVTLTALGSSSNEPITVISKGTGIAALEAASSSGSARVKVAGNAIITVNSTTVAFAVASKSASSNSTYLFTAGAGDSSLTAGTEVKEVFFDLAQTKTHASNTAITLQRHFHIAPPTDAFASAGGVISDAAAVAITGPPTGGSNATLTRAHALLVETRALANTTDAFGGMFKAPTGASNLNIALAASRYTPATPPGRRQAPGMSGTRIHVGPQRAHPPL